MSFWRKYKEFDRKIADQLDINKKAPEGYFNKWFFRAWSISVFGMVLYILVSTGFDLSPHEYYSCPITSPMPCVYAKYSPQCPEENPVCRPEKTIRMQPGETVGERPPFIIENFVYIALGLMFLAFGLNHLYYEYRRKK